MPLHFSSEAQATSLAAYLADFRDLDAVRLYKEESDALMRHCLASFASSAAPATACSLRMLEVGCGLGDDLASFVASAPTSTLGFGLDHNAALLQLAEERHAGRDNLRFIHGNITDLPFSDGFLHACRADRVLQHIANVPTALRELHRVLSAGGALLLLDADWDTLVIDSSLRGTTEVICKHFRSGITQPCIGRELRRHCAAAGFQLAEMRANTLLFSELEKAEAVLGLQDAALAAMDAGLISAETAVDWIASLRAQSERGEFFCAVTGFAVCAVKREKA